MSRRVCGVAYHEDSLEPENEVEQLLCKKKFLMILLALHIE
jgi:hypothetical protein